MKKFYGIALVMFLLAASNLLINCSRDKSSITGTEPEETDQDSLVYRKPNIYLYPEQETALNVSISFPMGGRVTVSEPAYTETGWNITVAPNGTIDGTWSFLFYECKIPNFAQTKEGWRVEQNNLGPFFNSVLQQYGLNNQEISDFLEYWLPILTEYDEYMVYPQTRDILDQVVGLQFSEQPSSLLRVFFYFKAATGLPEPAAPVIENFERTGFTVIEWGGALKE